MSSFLLVWKNLPSLLVLQTGRRSTVWRTVGHTSPIQLSGVERKHGSKWFHDIDQIKI
jgi:hypothetical protein